MKTNPSKLGLALAGTLALTVSPARADTFGSGGNAFTIDFVNIGNAGNGNDATGTSYTADGGLYGSGTTFGLGGVSYAYRMGTYEISQAQTDKATASGLLNVTAGAWTGNQPAANMTWYEAAAFVNWLNTSTGHQSAYNLTQIPPGVGGSTWIMALWTPAEAWQAGGQNLYRNKDAYYFLPSESEWYKATYHKNDGVTANYWDYATGSNTAPTAVASGTGAETAVYNHVTASPAAVNNNGGLSAYGTMGQNGNVYEWQETAGDGVNDDSSEIRVYRGGSWGAGFDSVRSERRFPNAPPSDFVDVIGFRVASVTPEPSSLALLAAAAVGLGSRRNRKTL